MRIYGVALILLDLVSGGPFGVVLVLGPVQGGACLLPHTRFCARAWAFRDRSSRLRFRLVSSVKSFKNLGVRIGRLRGLGEMGLSFVFWAAGTKALLGVWGIRV